MLPYPRIVEELERLNGVTNDIANEIEVIRKRMTGRGISPDRSSLVEMKLQEIENKLRMLGGNLDDPIPFK